MSAQDPCPALSPDAQALLAPWPGPCGGLPPYDRATPAALAEALPQAVAERRRAVRAIADNAASPTFDNTVVALESSARALRDVHALAMSVATTASVGDMPAVAQRLAPLVPALELEIAHDRALFARVEAVWQVRHETGLDAQQQRLVEVLHRRLLRAGAALGDAEQSRLKAIDARIAVLQSSFNQNLLAEQSEQATWFTDAADLEGLSKAQREAAAAAARARPGRRLGHPQPAPGGVALSAARQAARQPRGRVAAVGRSRWPRRAPRQPAAHRRDAAAAG